MKPQFSTLDKIRTRPRFKLHCKLDPKDYSENLKKYLEEHKEEFIGNINQEMATIAVRSEENPYFKPYISLRIEVEDNHTIIRGVFGPSSAVWTFFVFMYSLFIMAWMVFITLWYVGTKIKIPDYNWCLYASIFCLIAILGIYWGARYGQSKALREMAQLRRLAIESTLPYEDVDYKEESY